MNNFCLSRAFHTFSSNSSRHFSRYNRLVAIRRGNLRDTLLIENKVEPLQTGNVLLQVDRFSLTANTITYARVGDKFGYWDFHKYVHEYGSGTEYGFVPAIGWGSVIESCNDQIPVGGKFFGWFPMSKYCTLSAEKLDSGIRDVGSHREKHGPVYTTFASSEVDPYYTDSSLDGEDRQALLLGLFLTSFLANEFLIDKAYFKVPQ